MEEEVSWTERYHLAPLLVLALIIGIAWWGVTGHLESVRRNKACADRCRPFVQNRWHYECVCDLTSKVPEE